MTFPRRGALVAAVFFTVMACMAGDKAISPASAKSSQEKVGQNNVGFSSSSSEALAHFLMGNLHDNAGKTELATEEYRKALALEPGNPEIQVKLGSSLLLSGKFPEAAETLKKAIESDPGNVGGHLLLAFIHTARNELPEAKKCYEKALQLDPGNVRAMTFLADLFIQENKIEEAAAIYEKIASADEGDISAYFNLGILYGKLGRFESARKALEKAIELDPEYIEARLLLGFLYEVEGNRGEAEKFYLSVTDIDEKNVDALIRLSQIYRKSGLFEKAIEENKKIMEIEPFSPDPYLASYVVYVEAERYAEAEAVLLEALNQGFVLGAVYSGLGYAATKKGDHSAALGYYGKALEKSPRNDEYKFYMALSLDYMGRKEESVDVLEKAVKDGTKLPEIYNYLGYSYAEEGKDLEEAEKLVKKAIAIDPENGAYIDSLGWVYYRQGEIEKALQEIIRALEYLPDDATVREHLGDVYYSKGEIKKAIQEWQRSLQIDPSNEGIKEKIKNTQQ